MSLQDYAYRNVPEYYPDMWRDGYTPYEVMYPFSKIAEKGCGLTFGKEIEKTLETLSVSRVWSC